MTQDTIQQHSLKALLPLNKKGKQYRRISVTKRNIS